MFERAVRLGVCSRLAGRRIDDAAGDAKTIARPLEAADDGQVDGESSAERRQVATDAADGFDDLDAIDHAQRGRAQIVADGFSDSRCQPGQRTVAADVLEIQDGNRADSRGFLRSCIGRKCRSGRRSLRRQR